MTEVRICHLYPNHMNIYGDRGNISVLTKDYNGGATLLR